ncbi:MAG: hypothetical protein WDO06_07675 [Actinomycetota bacterium]
MHELIALALAGNQKLAEKKVNRAVKKSQWSLGTHSDPLFIATATQLAIEYMNHCFSNEHQNRKYLDALHDRLIELQPTQINKSGCSM